MIGLKSWTIEDRLTHSYWILKRHLIHPFMNSLKANCLTMESWQNIEMDRFFSLLQTTMSCCKWSKIWLGSSYVGCPPGHHSWSLVVLFVHKWHLIRYWVWNKTFCWWLCLLSEIKDEEDTMKLQSDIDWLGSWARKWGMRFQPVKCNMMQLTRKRIKKIHALYTLEGTDLEYIEIPWSNNYKWFEMEYTCKQCLH